MTHEVTCAYLEIYNEQLTDLLSSGDVNGDCIAMDGMMVEDSGNNTGSIPSLGSFSGGGVGDTRRSEERYVRGEFDES